MDRAPDSCNRVWASRVAPGSHAFVVAARILRRVAPQYLLCQVCRHVARKWDPTRSIFCARVWALVLGGCGMVLTITLWRGHRQSRAPREHDRQPPPEYLECFAPNVELAGPKYIVIIERENPLTAESIRECEAEWARVTQNAP